MPGSIKAGDAFPRGQLPGFMLFPDPGRAATHAQAGFERRQLVHHVLHMRRPRHRIQNRHALLSYAFRTTPTGAFNTRPIRPFSGLYGPQTA